jgi:drug/metabolite transporter (DMT)-like permease
VVGIAVVRETPTAPAWAGMLLISCGVFAVAFRATGRAGHAPSRAAIGFALANAAVIAAYTLVDGRGTRASGNVLGYVTWLFVLDALPLSLYMLIRHGRRFGAYLAANPRRGLIGGCLSAVAYAIALWAMARAPVALVASLRETSVLFAALIGTWMLKERLDLRRWIGVIAVAAGVVCLKLA